jgi:hypothetical protein
MTKLTCTCGQTALSIQGPPILAVTCCCTSCRSAASRLAIATDALGATPFVLFRKDRVTLPAPEQLREVYLTPSSKTRRIVSACCHTPLFLEFKGGHWLSLYASLWPAGTAPKATLRTMTSDLPPGTLIPADMHNAKTQSLGFMAKLATSWAAMGFRSPRVETGGTYTP